MEALTGTPESLLEAQHWQEPPSDHVSLRILEARASARDRLDTVTVEEKGRWMFPAEHYRRLVRHAPADIAVLFADGDSMMPTLTPNAPLLVLIRKPQPLVDGIWVLRQRGLVMFKRLHFSFEHPAKITIISDNPRYPQEQVTMDGEQPDFDLVGRVIGVITSY
jgi:phage repressor protein C with HTH and peptisase S24 domain